MARVNREEVLKRFEEQKEFMQERIQSGIEQNRKGYCKLKVKDADGNAVKNARIHVKQKTHEFKFGANIFMLEELETAQKNEKYKEFFSNLFNMATIPFYWDALEPEKGKQRYAADSPKIYRRPAPDLCLAFCKEHGIEPREHALCYDGFFPRWLRGEDVFTVKKELSRRIREVAGRYAEHIPTMEVTNETFWPQGNTCFYAEDDFVDWCFQEVRKYMPANKLAINEATYEAWNHLDTSRNMYYMAIERALSHGTPIDAIGMQYHMFHRKEDIVKKTVQTYDPGHLYRRMDLFSRFGKPLQITEVTIPAYSNEAEDEQLQADIITYLYSIWFSHANVEQIVYWNLVDGYAAFAPQGDMTAGENYYYGGLVRFDFTKKPAYHALENLIKKEWHTEAECVSDGEGNAGFHGFFGEYDVEIEADGRKAARTIDYRKHNQDHEIEMVL